MELFVKRVIPDLPPGRDSVIVEADVQGDGEQGCDCGRWYWRPLGGLLPSEGCDCIAGMFRRAADYVDRITKGAMPADLPIEQPTKFEFVIKLKTAHAIGVDLRSSVLLLADEVIE